MLELLHEAFLPVNAVSTILFTLVMIYWILVILGALDISFLDFDIDLDGDLDADVDMDADIDGEMTAPAGLSGLWYSMMAFFFVGQVPFMIIASFLALFMWIVSILGNYYWNPERSLFIGILIWHGNIILSALLTRICMGPMSKIFKAVDQDNSTIVKVGNECTVMTTELSDNLGQAEIITNGAPVILNVKSNNNVLLHKGDSAIIVKIDKENGIYHIAPKEKEN